MDNAECLDYIALEIDAGGLQRTNGLNRVLGMASKRREQFSLRSIASLLLAASLATAAEPPPPPANSTIGWENQRLSVTAEAAPIAELLDAIAGKTGMEVQGIDRLRGNADASFAGLSLKEALQVLLPNARYSFDELTSASGTRRVLSIFSYTPAETTASAPDPLPSAETLAVAGFVPDAYRKLYGWAEHGDLKALRKAATEGDPTTQTIAMQLLAKQDPEQAAKLAANALTQTETNRRIDAVRNLGEIDSEAATDALAGALNDRDLVVRQSALMALNGQSSDQAIPLLARALQDRDASIRLLALDLLAEKGADGASGITAALQDADYRIRDHARRLLAQLSAGE